MASQKEGGLVSSNAGTSRLHWAGGFIVTMIRRVRLKALPTPLVFSFKSTISECMIAVARPYPILPCDMTLSAKFAEPYTADPWHSALAQQGRSLSIDPQIQSALYQGVSLEDVN